MKVSICIATFNKAKALKKTLHTIFVQNPSFDWEVIVVDDGSDDETYELCLDAVDYSRFDCTYKRIYREPFYRNPSVARNVAYKMAKGEIIICQSDDVMHKNFDTIERLITELTPGHFVIGAVYNVDENGNRYSDKNGKGYGDKLSVYTSPQRKRPLFFLGSLYRKDLYAVGGNDEEFVKPSREDVWFALCLQKGLGLDPIYSENIVGLHQHHKHCTDYQEIQESHNLFQKKLQQATDGEIPWKSSGGSWGLDSTPTVAVTPP